MAKKNDNKDNALFPMLFVVCMFVSKLVNSGINICLVQKLSNHRNIGTTQRYFNYNSQMLSNAVESIRV